LAPARGSVKNLGVVTQMYAKIKRPLSLTTNTMTRIIQISPGVAFAAIILSPEWSDIAVGGLHVAPAQVSNSARVVAPTMASTTKVTHEIEQLGLI